MTLSGHNHYFFTFRVSRRRREMYSGHALSVCLCVCLSVRGRMPTLLHEPQCNLGRVVGDAPSCAVFGGFAIGAQGTGRQTDGRGQYTFRLGIRTHTSFGDRSFIVAGPRVWNALPPSL